MKIVRHIRYRVSYYNLCIKTDIEYTFDSISKAEGYIKRCFTDDMDGIFIISIIDISRYYKQDILRLCRSNNVIHETVIK